MTSPSDPLSPELVALVRHIASPMGEVADLIEAQAAQATVVGNSPTMLDVTVPENIDSIPISDGPIPVRALVHDESGQPSGEVLVWVRSGKLAGLEQAWFTDEPPSAWPDTEAVRLN